MEHLVCVKCVEQIVNGVVWGTSVKSWSLNSIFVENLEHVETLEKTRDFEVFHTNNKIGLHKLKSFFREDLQTSSTFAYKNLVFEGNYAVKISSFFLYICCGNPCNNTFDLQASHVFDHYFLRFFFSENSLHSIVYTQLVMFLVDWMTSLPLSPFLPGVFVILFSALRKKKA